MKGVERGERERVKARGKREGRGEEEGGRGREGVVRVDKGREKVR